MSTHHGDGPALRLHVHAQRAASGGVVPQLTKVDRLCRFDRQPGKDRDAPGSALGTGAVGPAPVRREGGARRAREGLRGCAGAVGQYNSGPVESARRRFPALAWMRMRPAQAPFGVRQLMRLVTELVSDHPSHGLSPFGVPRLLKNEHVSVTSRAGCHNVETPAPAVHARMDVERGDDELGGADRGHGSRSVAGWSVVQCRAIVRGRPIRWPGAHRARRRRLAEHLRPLLAR